MPSKQTSSAQSRKPAQSSSRTSAPSRRGMAATGERDEHFNLVSVLYHALEGADACGQYIEDARRAGDPDLAEFFEEARAEQADRAAQAKRMLAERIEVDSEAEDFEEDDEDEFEDEDEDEDEEED